MVGVPPPAQQPPPGTQGPRIVGPPAQIPGAAPVQQPVQQAPPPPPPKSAEATIEEIPQEHAAFARGLRDFVRELEADESNLSQAARKGLQDAKAKLPLVYAALRDGLIDDQVKDLVSLFIQKLKGSDNAGAAQVKKQLASQITKCKELFFFITYIHNTSR
jgi:hypothetical protein